jgi:hypothetical protein
MKAGESRPFAFSMRTNPKWSHRRGDNSLANSFCVLIVRLMAMARMTHVHDTNRAARIPARHGDPMRHLAAIAASTLGRNPIFPYRLADSRQLEWTR